MSQPPVTSTDVSRLFGELSAERIAEIIATGASQAELEQVAALVDQMDDVIGEPGNGDCSRGRSPAAPGVSSATSGCK